MAVTPGSYHGGMSDDNVPGALRTGAAWSWRILVIVAVVALAIWLIITFRVIVIPFMIAVLLSSILVPFSNWLQSHRWPRWAAVVVAFIGGLCIVGGLVALVVWQVRGGFEGIRDRTLVAADDLSAWLAGPPFNVDLGDLPKRIADWWTSFQADPDFWDRVLSLGSTAGHIATGLLLALFATLFLLIDGDGVWAWFVRIFPRRARTAVDGAGRAGWRTLTSFTRVQIFVAAVDAVGIGLGAWILGLFFPGGFPLVIPLAIAVFLASFVPLVGALLTGAFAVLIALVYLGVWPAIIMLAIVLFVQEVEGHVLQPLVMGPAVKVHPLAVVFAVAAGGLIAGIPGSLFAVPLVAVVNVMIRYFGSGTWRTTAPATGEDGRTGSSGVEE